MTKSRISQILLLSLMVTAAIAQRSGASRLFPIYANGGLPDLTVDTDRLVSQMQVVDRYFAPDDCAIAENVVGGSGYRRLLRFDTVLMNRGDGDLVVGNRADPANPYSKYFVLHQCHGHYHIENFTVYELVNSDGVTVMAGTKQGFCMEDSFKYDDGGKSKGYDCENQGITSGWGDWYYKQLVGQWIDITGVPEGDYKVRVTINKRLPNSTQGIFNEGLNQYPNTVEVPFHVPNPRNKVEIVN